MQMGANGLELVFVVTCTEKLYEDWLGPGLRQKGKGRFLEYMQTVSLAHPGLIHFLGEPLRTDRGRETARPTISSKDRYIPRVITAYVTLTFNGLSKIFSSF